MRAFVVVASVLSISAEICDETVLLQVGSSLKQDPQIVHAHLQGDSPLPDGEGQLVIDAWLDIHHIPGNSDDDSTDDQSAALSVGHHREHDVHEDDHYDDDHDVHEDDHYDDDHDVHEDDHYDDDHDEYHEVHNSHGELDSDFWLGEDDLTIEEPQKEAVREAFKAVDEVAVKEHFPPKEMEEELFDVNLQTVPLAVGLEAVEEHFEEAFEKLQPFHSNGELDVIEEEFFKKVEPHFQELECDDWDHDCKLPPMSENRCIRQCAWESWNEDSDSSALEINSMCLKVCECEVDQCDDKLAGYDVGELFHDHHAAMKTGNWDFDWELSNSVKGDTGFNDCARRQCNHMWSERHSMHCGIDWAAGNPWKKIQIHNEDGSLKQIRGIPVTDDVVDENAPRSCDEKCEACGKCENRCAVESEDFCGTNELRAESCANAEWASDWCYKDFWSCKWETGPESCHCWNMDDDQMHSYDTCASDTTADDSNHSYDDSISTTGEANITAGSDYGYYEEFPFLKQQKQSRREAHNNFLIQQGVAQRAK